MFIRFLILWLIALLWQIILYFSSQYLEGEPHVVGGKLDEKLPVVPIFIYIYVSWYFLLGIVPFSLWCTNPKNAVHYLLAWVLNQAISFIAFLSYPTTFTRPSPAGKGLTHKLFCFIYGANHRFLNCAPSVHCSVSMLFILSSLVTPQLPIVLRIFFSLMGCLICVSTMLVKQHVLIDFFTALPLPFLVWKLAEYLPIDKILNWSLGL